LIHRSFKKVHEGHPNRIYSAPSQAQSALADRELQRRFAAIVLCHAHFISATPTVIVPSEIAEFEELDGDLVEGLEVIEDAIRLPAGPGLGVNLTV
jgi:hypothetical protein